jgi:hypothetical protein
MSILAPTVRGAWTRTTSGTTPASGSHTPATNDFLICVVYATHATNVFTDTGTCAGNGQTWTKRVGILSADTHEYFAIFTAGPVAAGSAGATTVTINVATTEAWVGVHGYAAVASTLDTTTPYVASGGATFAASTGPSASIGAPADPSNARHVFWAHRKGEVTTPRAGWTELTDTQTSPGSGVNAAVEGQHQGGGGGGDNSVSASWATSVVGMYGYIETANGKVLTAAETNAYDDTSDSTATAGNAESGWNLATTYLYNERPVDRYGVWG